MSNTRFELSRVAGTPITDDELLADLRRVAGVLKLNTVPQRKYAQFGIYGDSTPVRRFGSWNKALAAAGLDVTNELQVSDERLFENLFSLWQHLGRQPRRSDLATDASRFSQGPYLRRFGSWTAALREFVKHANASDTDPEVGKRTGDGATAPRRMGREPSLRLRFRVLLRDNFACRQCGASPAITRGVELHVDHVVAWSKGGSTTLENLQTLCSSCNIGKGNLEGRAG